MATSVIVRKLYGSVVPADAANAELFEALKLNGEYTATFVQTRNIKFHRKAFALIKVAFDALDFGDKEHKGVKVQKNIDQFRDDVTILAGYYDVVFNYAGEMRLKAKSWSFASMDETEFEAMYSRMIDVILAKILTNYTRDDIDHQVERILQFT